MSSGEFNVIAVLYPKQGKADRVRILISGILTEQSVLTDLAGDRAALRRFDVCEAE